MSGVLSRVFEATEEANRRAILRALPRECEAPMLDIGPHQGHFTQRVAEHVGATDVRGIELIPDHAEAARSRGIEISLGDVDNGLPYEDQTFGLVLANQVIEHVRKTDLFMQEVRRVLRPGGVACISTNNLGSWHNVISLALGYQPMPMHVSDQIILGNPLNPEHGTTHEDLGRTHLRLFTMRALVELGQLHGLEPVQVRTVGYYPLPTRAANCAVRIDPRHGAYTVALLRRPLSD